MDLLSIGVDAARAGGALVREAFARPRTGVSTKSTPTDAVTATDRASEETIHAMIRELRPDDGFLGEETGVHAGTSGIRWIVDPLDGTVNFLYGVPQVCVSVACENEEGTLVGVVFDPIRDEIFVAGLGRGATCNGAPISVGRVAEPAQALIATGFSYVAEERRSAAEMLAHVLPSVRDLRRAGSAALDLAWVAAGRYDGYYEAPCLPWDGAAGALLVAEAGGRVEPLAAIGPTGPGLIASNRVLFEPLSDLVERARTMISRHE